MKRASESCFYQVNVFLICRAQYGSFSKIYFKLSEIWKGKIILNMPDTGVYNNMFIYYLSRILKL